MKYPDGNVGPKTQTEMYALLFGMLAAAYDMLVQYERDEDKCEHERIRRHIDESLS